MEPLKKVVKPNMVASNWHLDLYCPTSSFNNSGQTHQSESDSSEMICNPSLWAV